MGKYLFFIVLFAFIIMLIILLVLRGSEDDWIKDSKGVWIKHGVPSNTPEQVLEQQEAINCALDLYQKQKDENISFSSKCLGTCKDYAVDLVHTPRTEEDNLPENQCSDFREGNVSHFIELDENGEIVRIV